MVYFMDIYRQSVVYVDCIMVMHELGSLIIEGNYPYKDVLNIFQSMCKRATDTS